MDSVRPETGQESRKRMQMLREKDRCQVVLWGADTGSYIFCKTEQKISGEQLSAIFGMVPKAENPIYGIPSQQPSPPSFTTKKLQENRQREVLHVPAFQFLPVYVCYIPSYVVTSAAPPSQFLPRV